MAIVNITPDSFYDQGATNSLDLAVARAGDVIAQGAGIVDIGGVKAGPGAVVTTSEEIERVVPVIQAVHAAHPDVTISVDTWRSEVADAAIQAGATLVNDTWAGHDPELSAVAGQYQVGYVCSHTGGVTPRTRPHRVRFDDLLAQVIQETTSQAELAVSRGVPEERILIDPTHDFGKNTFHGLELLRRIDELVATGWPVLMALSNKDFVGETLDRPVRERVAGTLAATAWAAQHGVAAFRSHEVAETVDVIRMVAAIQGKVAPLNTTRGLA
ncbi:dihydropteroate synthase [Corynebacterium sp. 153RC1]|uniref:dihydropteroate synthase n=1 Tax=unclassified Corynebacterium TaxID=2624378 RepID=UPI00211BED0E|nr:MULTISPECIES: dihydropteroate synthase [unclassified Corynebacterium]MCQ9370359.1 dihydropteroate synthase [Corynebacterium sp. 35RC1]MCQ9351965.1 dihydropteroate synthase [Corynebacterium sp. 209RC1]MCQ9353714.1 dihydropteroate synthase [Corynebacterium sp. 1222RC1]MCQ9356302.1 dihydropteroate synthase [Corynebacterium sp. 122RC1]MCQ9358404.1 dihydropteroate synthase [Corynebacterium sp. 142RC1]